MNNRMFILVAIATLPVCAFAIDGVTLINQSTVMAAGGFPYVISQPGSYKLSGNLIVPANGIALEIFATNVTLDLNGFSITTPPGGFGEAIVLNYTATAVTVRNGAITGFSLPLNSHSDPLLTLEDLFVTGAGGGGTWQAGLGPFSRVVHVSTPDGTFAVQCPSVVAETAANSIVIAGGTGACSLSNNATLF